MTERRRTPPRSTRPNPGVPLREPMGAEAAGLAVGLVTIVAVVLKIAGVW